MSRSDGISEEVNLSDVFYHIKGTSRVANYHGGKYIYKITNPRGFIYIGQTSNLKIRLSCYKGAHCKSQSKLYYSIKKYGWSAHDFEIIDSTGTKEELNKLEIKWIKSFNSYNTPRGLNLAEGGNGTMPLSEEHKRKISIANKGRKMTDATKQKLINSNKGNNHRWGIPHSEETKEKLRIANIGNKNCVGYVHTKAARLNMSKGKIEYFKHNKWNQESIDRGHEKLSILFGTKLLCHQNGKIYNSIVKAEKDLGMGSKRINRYLKGLYETANGYTFEILKK